MKTSMIKKESIGVASFAIVLILTVGLLFPSVLLAETPASLAQGNQPELALPVVSLGASTAKTNAAPQAPPPGTVPLGLTLQANPISAVSMQPIASKVPAGWTAVASNPDFAYRISVSPVNGNKDLHILDLATNKDYTALRGGANVSITNVDVVSNGRYAMFKYADYLGKPTSYVYHFETGILAYQAASNPRFAFYYGDDRYSSRLGLIDLKTGQTQVLASAFSPQGTAISGVWDVSPDGKVVVYTIVSYWAPGGDRSETYFQDIQDPLNKFSVETFNGTVDGISFAGRSRAVLQSQQTIGGSVIGKVTNVDCLTRAVTVRRTSLIKQGETAFSNPKAKILVITGVVYGKGRMLIYDISRGTNNMRLLQDIIVSPNYPYPGFWDALSFRSIYRAPRRNSIVSVSYLLSANGPYETRLVNARNGKELTFSGKAVSVKYFGNFALYTVLDENGATRTVRIDLRSLMDHPTLVPKVMPKNKGPVRLIAHI